MTLQTIILAASALLAVVLLVLMYFAWRGKVISTHPHCRRCRFDLHGLPETSAYCPECGSAITIAKNRLPVLRKRQRAAAAACLVGILCIAYGGGAALGVNHGWHTALNLMPDPILVAYWKLTRGNSAEAQIVSRLFARNDAATLIDPLIDIAFDSRADYDAVNGVLRPFAQLTSEQRIRRSKAWITHARLAVTAPPTRHFARPAYFDIEFDAPELYLESSTVHFSVKAFHNGIPVPPPTCLDGNLNAVADGWEHHSSVFWPVSFHAAPTAGAKPGDTYSLLIELTVQPEFYEYNEPSPIFSKTVRQSLHRSPTLRLLDTPTNNTPPFTATFESSSDGSQLYIDLQPTGQLPLLVSGTLIINGQRLTSHASVALRHDGTTRIAFDVPTIPPTVDLEVFSIPEDFESDARFTSTWHGYVTLPSLPIPASAQRTRISPDPFPQRSPERISSRERWDLLNTLRTGQEPPNLQATIQLLLDAQGDTSHPWDRQIASALELLYLQNKLTPAQWHRYLRQAIDTTRVAHYIDPEFVGLIGPRLAESGIVDLSDLKLEVFNSTGQLLATDPQPLSSRLIMTARSINVSGHSPPFTLHLTGSIRGGDTTIPIDKTWAIPTP